MKINQISAKFGKGFCILLLIAVIAIGLAPLAGCSNMFEDKDSISELSFSHDGKKVVFDRCKNHECRIQVYDLETGELAAYQSPKGERWTMGRYSYDGRQIAFSVIPVKPEGGLDLNEMQIAVMDADGKNFKKVTSGPGAKLYPAFSHNGKKILYARAARIREKGKTPAADYDAWEVHLETGEQTQLTFFEYFYMGYLTYFPDDERFIYYGNRPGVYEGMRSYPDEEAFRVKMGELERQGKRIAGVVVMKGKELIPMPYHFPRQTFPEKPLLSEDGSRMIYQKSHSGKFYLYSEDGKHRLVGSGGSVDAATISPDGEVLAMIVVNKTIDTFTTGDGKRKQILYLPCALKIENFEKVMKKSKTSYKLIPSKSLQILNQ